LVTVGGRPKITKAKEFWTFFGIQFFQYFLITVNYRAIAEGLLAWTFASDLAVGANSFFLIKKVAEAKGTTALFGYLSGGAFGSIFAIAATKWLATHGGF
jgi:hypothetical protein